MKRGGSEANKRLRERGKRRAREMDMLTEDAEREREGKARIITDGKGVREGKEDGFREGKKRETDKK